MLGVSIKVDIRETVRKLDTLGKKLRRKALRSACHKVGTSMTKEAKANVPLRFSKSDARQLKLAGVYAGGQLKKSIGKKVKSYSKAAVAIVGPRHGFRIQVNAEPPDPNKHELDFSDPKQIVIDPTKYAHLVDRGTRHSAPRPFIDPAVRLGIKLIDGVLKTEVDKIIDEVAKS